MVGPEKGAAPVVEYLGKGGVRISGGAGAGAFFRRRRRSGRVHRRSFGRAQSGTVTNQARTGNAARGD
jgi:hypothetical protein